MVLLPQDTEDHPECDPEHPKNGAKVAALGTLPRKLAKDEHR